MEKGLNMDIGTHQLVMPHYATFTTIPLARSLLPCLPSLVAVAVEMVGMGYEGAAHLTMGYAYWIKLATENHSVNKKKRLELVMVTMCQQIKPVRSESSGSSIGIEKPPLI